jgi:hypothetical protein
MEQILRGEEDDDDDEEAGGDPTKKPKEGEPSDKDAFEPDFWGLLNSPQDPGEEEDVEEAPPEWSRPEKPTLETKKDPADLGLGPPAGVGEKKGALPVLSPAAEDRKARAAGDAHAAGAEDVPADGRITARSTAGDGAGLAAPRVPDPRAPESVPEESGEGVGSPPEEVAPKRVGGKEAEGEDEEEFLEVPAGAGRDDDEIDDDENTIEEATALRALVQESESES